MTMTLGYYPFITTVLVMIVVLNLLFFNVRLLVKYKKSILLLIVNAFSFFFAIGLIFYMLSVAISLIPLSITYVNLAKISFFVSALLFFIGMFIRFWTVKNYCFTEVSPNISKALSRIEDIVFVVDSEGMMTHINHVSDFKKVFGDVDQFEKLKESIQFNCDENSELLGPCELNFEKEDTYYRLKLLPIKTEQIDHVGYTGVLQDITEIKKSEILLKEHYQYLTHANEKLRHSVRLSGSLEAENERLELIRHIQETLIYKIEAALKTLRQINTTCYEDGTYSVKMKELTQLLRSIYQDVRIAVDKIARKDTIA